jgi:hypothetical protein
MPDYRQLFDSTPPQEAPQAEPPVWRDLFGTPAAPPGLAEATPSPTPQLLSIASREGVQYRYNELAREHEGLMHRVLDLSQTLKQREHQLGQQFEQVRQQCTEVQVLLSPRRSFLGKTRAISNDEKTRAHALIDQLQAFLASDLRPNLFMQNEMQELQAQTAYLERLSAVLQADGQSVLSNQDELRQRIETQTHILRLQAKSTQQLIAQLNTQLDTIEQWRSQTLALLVIEIQHKL